MAYNGIEDWRAVVSPMMRALDGNPDPIGFDEDWDDEGTLDPWGQRQRDAQEAKPVQIEAPEVPSLKPQRKNFEIVLPQESDVGRREADRNAAMKGVNPGRTDGGAGHLFDLAKTFIGTPYVFGAAGPTAFDCSGFTQYLFSRTYGVALPHSARQQASVLPKVSRDELQPGDLIFYSYGRLGKEVDHVEVFMGGGKQIGTSNPSEDLDIDNVDWDNVSSFGRVVGGSKRAPDPMGPKVKTKTVKRQVPNEITAVNTILQPGQNDFTSSLAELLAGETLDVVRTVKVPKFRGAGGTIKQQLYRGFVDAGREDLARMVSTKDFQTWINAESSWNPSATSPANNHGKANDGLFQVWRGHDFNANGQVAQMSPYEQAQLITKYFSHLTPDAIRSYAEAIRGGSYSGWG